MMKHIFLFHLLLFINVFSSTLGFTQPSSFELQQTLSLNDYLGKTYSSTREIPLKEIVGLEFIGEKQLFWANQSGTLFYWELTQNYPRSSCFELDCFLNNAFLHPKKPSIVLNCGAAQQDILVGDLNSCTFERLIDENSSQFHSLAVSPDGKNMAALAESLLLHWQLEETTWNLKKYTLSNDLSFTLNFLNDQMLLVGTHEGNLTAFDLTKEKVDEKWLSAHPSTVAVIKLSLSKNYFATTNGEEVTIWHSNNKEHTIKIKTNLKLLGDLCWINDEELAIGGLNDEIEVWNIKENKLLQSINTSTPKNSITALPQPTGKAVLFHKNLHKNRLDSSIISNRITALRINDNKIITLGLENLDLVNYQIRPSGIQESHRMNLEEAPMRLKDNAILSVQASPLGNKVYAGLKYGVGYFDIVNSHIIAAMGNLYRSYSQVDLFEFQDIGLLKVDDAMDNYNTAYLAWEVYYNAFQRKKSSILYKERQKLFPLKNGQEQIPAFEQLTNPSGFTTSTDQKYIASFDSTGKIQIFQVKGMLPLSSFQLNEPIKKVFFETEEKIIIATGTGNIYSTFLASPKSIRKDFSIASSIQNIAYNQLQTLAFSSKNKLYTLNIQTKELHLLFENTPKKHLLSHISFVPNHHELVWVINELPTSKQEILVKTPLPPVETMIVEMTYKNGYLVTGNQDGAINIYKK